MHHLRILEHMYQYQEDGRRGPDVCKWQYLRRQALDSYLPERWWRFPFLRIDSRTDAWYFVILDFPKRGRRRWDTSVVKAVTRCCISNGISSGIHSLLTRRRSISLSSCSSSAKWALRAMIREKRSTLVRISSALIDFFGVMTNLNPLPNIEAAENGMVPGVVRSWNDLLRKEEK